jgi:hypothetical protein
MLNVLKDLHASSFAGAPDCRPRLARLRSPRPTKAFNVLPAHHLAHDPLSTMNGQTGILMDVHSVLQGITEVSQPQLPRLGPSGQPIESSQLGLKLVSADIRTGLCSRAGIPPGKGLARPETGGGILATLADSGRQRPRDPGSPAAKPRKVKDYCDGARKPELRRTAWWSWQDSNRRASDYARHQ